MTKNFYGSFFYNEMPYLKIDVPFKTIDYLKKNISVAIKYNYLSFAENNYKPAKITYKDNIYNIQLRLKGLTNFHRTGNKKSLKIRLKKKSNELAPSILGFSEFNLMDPKRRWNEKEWLFRKVASKENLLERRYDFVKVKINGDNSGIYSIEENFAKEFFEYNKIKPAPILSVDSDKLYGISSFTQCCGHNYINDFLFSPVQSKDKIYEDENYNNQYNYAKKSLVDALSSKLPIDQILNLDKFGRFLALSDIFGGWHGSETTNLKLYFNPYTKLIEPIPDDMFDESRNKHTRDFALFRIRNVGGYSIFYDRLFDDLNFLKIYYDYLKKYSDKEFVKNIFEENKYEYNKVKKIIAKDNLYYSPRTKKDLINNAKTIREFINPGFPIEVFKIYQDSEKYLHLDLQNNFYFPLEIRKILINKKAYNTNEVLNPKKLSLNSIFDNSFFEITEKPKRRNISIKANFEYYKIREIKIFFSIGNNEKLLSFKVPDINLSDMDFEFSSNVQDYKDKINIDEKLKKIKLINNKLNISDNLILPKDFTFELNSDSEIILEGSANLIIESDIFYSKNDSLEENVKHTIKFISKGDNCILFKNNSISVINLSFEGFSACKVGGFYLTSGVNFYKSNIGAKNLIAMNNKSGDDLINIVKSQFEISKIYLENSLYDGLDIDYSEGIASKISCFNCGKKEGGDGIDLSHSKIFIEELNIENSFDKGLSIGENTNLNIKNLNVANAKVCLANKDGSHSIISSVKISNCKIGIAAFTKKNYYFFSKLDIGVANFNNNEIDYVRDDKNKIIVNGWEIKDEKFIDNNIFKKIYE